MSSVCFRTFGLHDDVPEATLDPEWRALVSQQAHTLAEMLQRMQTAVAEGQRRTDALRLQGLAADAERLLTAQAQEHVNLEHELGELRALVTDVSPAPAALTQRVQRIERAPISSQIQTRIALLYAQGTSISHISKRLGIGYGTAWNSVQRLKVTETVLTA